MISKRTLSNNLRWQVDYTHSSVGLAEKVSKKPLELMTPPTFSIRSSAERMAVSSTK